MNEDTQALLLLTARFSCQKNGAPTPLTPVEWGRLAARLHECDQQPSVFFKQDPASVLGDWQDHNITSDRISRLFDRAAAMAIALDKWSRAGLWVMTCLDTDYPSRLIDRLTNCFPPVIFGCGNRRLLGLGGIAVVGSRDASSEELIYTKFLGRHITKLGVSVVSGGARGVDETAMLAALENSGTAVGILADSLLTAATSKKYRQYLMNNDLALISTFYPEARFDVGNAMTRNKYIYCLADSAIVISATEGKGGTWNGAIENLKQHWVPLWVKPDEQPNSGNTALVKKGARWLPKGKLDIDTLNAFPLIQTNNNEAPRLFDASLGNLTNDGNTMSSQSDNNGILTNTEENEDDLSAHEVIKSKSIIPLYDLFLRHIALATRDKAMTEKELCTLLHLHKAQFGEWLKRAVDEGRVRKLDRPIRYQWILEGSLFPSE